MHYVQLLKFLSKKKRDIYNNTKYLTLTFASTKTCGISTSESSAHFFLDLLIRNEAKHLTAVTSSASKKYIQITIKF